MSDINTDESKAPRSSIKTQSWRRDVLIAGGAFAIISYVIISYNPEWDIRFRPDFSRLLTVSPIIQLHIASALTSFFLGVWMIAAPKGSGMHIKLGWVWVIAMAITAISSFFIVGLNGRSFSFIHGLSAFTVIGLPMGIYAIRKGEVQKHAKSMTGMFLGGMIIAGLFTFLPGRFMWSLFFTI